MSFTIAEISRTGDEVTYGLYLDPAADPGSTGIDSFQFDIVFDTPDLGYVLGSVTYASAFFGTTNETNAATGTVTAGGIALPAWTSFNDPIITFKFDIASADPSEGILLDNVFLDGDGPSSVNLTIYPDNSPPTGSVTISDTTPAEGQLLTASNTIVDADTIPGVITYTWYVDGVETLVDSSTYTPVQADVGKVITVTATYTDGDGKPESVTSSATAAVANTNDEPVGFTASISGTIQEDSELTASASVTSDEDGLPDPLNFGYQWQISDDGTNWSNISGATNSTFTPGDDEAGRFIRVVASYTDEQGTLETQASAFAAVVNLNDVAVGFSASISGTVAENEELTASASVTSDDDGLPDPLTFSYQWQSSSNGSTWDDIGGATDSTFTPGSSEAGKFLRVVASYTDGQGTVESVNSGATVEVNAAPIGVVAISGTAQEDQELTAGNTLSDPDGIATAITYQWQVSDDGLSGWTDIGGATDSTFTLDDPQVGKFVRVVASYIDGEGKAENVASDATSAITNVNDDPLDFSATITGTAQEDTELTANPSVTSDDDGLPALPAGFSYQWQVSDNGVSGWSDIGGATASTFTPGDAEVDRFIRVVVSYTDDQGTEETTTSAATTAVANVNDDPVDFAATITGTVQEDSELTANPSVTSDADGLPALPGGFSYQWQVSDDGLSGWADIGSATASTFTPGDAEVGRFIRVVVSYTDGQGTVESTESAATVAVANVNDVPVDFGATITGSAQEDAELTANPTVTSDDDGLPALPGGFSYQWQESDDGVSGWSDIGSATASTFTPGDAEVGKFIRVVVSYTDLQGTEESTASAATTAVTSVNDDPVNFTVAITGTNSEGETLTAAVGAVVDDDGVGVLSYQWQRSNDVAGFDDISGATATTYTLVGDDIGRQIRLKVSYLDGQGTTEMALSAATSTITNTNDAPTGLPVLTGTFTEDQTVGVDLSGIADGDGLPDPSAFGYQWQRSVNGGASWTSIAGADEQNYTLGDEDSGNQVRVVVTYTDNGGTGESLNSAGQAVTNINDDPDGSVTISGTASEGQTLTAANTLSDEDGLGAITYSWFASGSGTPIGTGPSYTLTQAEVGKTITVVASYTDGQGTAESASSTSTAAVTNVGDAPTGSVTISGTAAEDQTLTASNDLADEDGLGEITYTWFASGSATPLDTGPTFELTQAEVGKTITVVASYIDGQGNPESVSSTATAEVANVNDNPTGAVTIAGTAGLGQMLTASNTLVDEDGLGAITYTWFASGSATPIGTGPTFTLTESEIGKTITVEASYTDGQGSAESVSSDPTATVTGINNLPTGSVIIVGDAEVGGALSAFNNLADLDGLGLITYQWQVDGVPVPGADGLTYEPLLADKGKIITVVASYTDGMGTAESVTSDPTDPVTNPGELIEGTPGPDILSGGDRDDTIVGFEGRDTLSGGAGDDQLQGDDDIDTAVYSGDLMDYSRVRDGNEIEISGPAADGIDILTDVERAQFNDLSVAYDIDGNAGQVARLLGVMLGKDDWFVREFVGIGLDFIDNAGISYEQLMDIALDAIMAINGTVRTDESVFTLLYTNVLGVAPSTQEVTFYAGLIADGTYTQESMAVAAAEFFLNEENIGLVGLVDTGLEYIPV